MFFGGKFSALEAAHGSGLSVVLSVSFGGDRGICRGGKMHELPEEP
mgnify:FL=1